MRFLLGAAILLAVSTPAFAKDDGHHDWSWDQDWHNCGQQNWPQFHTNRAPAPDLATGIPAILAVIGAYGAARLVSKKK